MIIIVNILLAMQIYLPITSKIFYTKKVKKRLIMYFFVNFLFVMDNNKNRILKQENMYFS